MTGSFRRGRGPVGGLTLIEILVASALFGLFTGMVAGAMVLAQRNQDAAVTKLDAVRRATLVLDLLVRDVQSAKYSSDVSMNSALPPAKSGSPLMGTQPVGVAELDIKRLREFPGMGNPTTTQRIVVGYWFDPGTGEPGKGMIRRVIYDAYSSPLVPVSGETADGRILVRDVRDFRVSSEVVGTLTFITAEIWIATIGNPISTSVALEPPAP